MIVHWHKIKQNRSLSINFGAKKIIQHSTQSSGIHSEEARQEGWTLVMASVDLTAVPGWLSQKSGQNAKLFRNSLYYFHSFFFFHLCHVAYRIPTRDQTHASCTESTDIYHWLRITGPEGKSLFRHSCAWALTELLLRLNRFCRGAQMIKFSSETRKSRSWCTWFIKSQIYIFRVPIIWQILLQKVHQQHPAFDQIHLVKWPINVLTKPGTGRIIQGVFFIQWEHNLCGKLIHGGKYPVE